MPYCIKGTDASRAAAWDLDQHPPLPAHSCPPARLPCSIGPAPRTLCRRRAAAPWRRRAAGRQLVGPCRTAGRVPGRHVAARPGAGAPLPRGGARRRGARGGSGRAAGGTRRAAGGGEPVRGGRVPPGAQQKRAHAAGAAGEGRGGADGEGARRGVVLGLLVGMAALPTARVAAVL